MASQEQIDFGPFQLDTANECLWQGAQRITLKPKTFSVLRYLIDRSDQLVTKDELLKTLWADVHVSSAVLKVCIREIREALDDPAKTPRFIETVHRRGYRFIGPVSRPASRVPRQDSESVLSTPFLVGREAELAQLHRWLEKAQAGARQIVFVTGEAGIGKTTLVETFLHQLVGQADLWVATGHCLEQYGAGEAYMPVLEAFGHLCRRSENERTREVLNQHAPMWLLQMPALLDSEEMEALQRRAVGASKERMLREMAEAVEELTSTRTLVLWFDDVHWSDYSTLDLISYLARRSQPARLLVICAYRPGEVIAREHPLKTLKQDLQLHRRCQELPVELLPQTAVQQYLAGRLVGNGVSERLTGMVHQRTEGNPLFMVNIVDHLVAQNVIARQAGRWELAGEVEAIETPTSIREFIEQQAEAVNPEAQRVLEAGSVAGMTFSAAVVAAGIGTAVGEVEKICEGLARQARFLRRQGAEEWPDGTVTACYGFAHALYQHILAERVTPGRRVELHRHIGERLETAYGARAGNIAAELALHFEQGRGYPQAVQYRWRAGRNAIRRHAHHEAINHLTKGLGLLEHLPDTPERTQQELLLQITLGEPMIAARSWAAPEVAAVYSRARELCQQVGDSLQLFPALAGLYRFCVVRGEYEEAQKLAEQLLRLAQSFQDHTLLLAAHGMMGYILFLRGELRLAREHLGQSIARYDLQHHQFFALRAGDDPGVASLSFSAWALWLCGYPDEALKKNHEALSLAHQLSHPHVLMTTLGLAAQFHHFRREWAALIEQADAVLTLAAKQGFPLWIAVGTILRYGALVRQGQRGKEITQIEQGFTTLCGIGAAALGSYWALLSEAYKSVGQAEKGLDVVTKALADIEKSGERFYEAELYRLKGELLLKLLKGSSSIRQ